MAAPCRLLLYLGLPPRCQRSIKLCPNLPPRNSPSIRKLRGLGLLYYQKSISTCSTSNLSTFLLMIALLIVSSYFRIKNLIWIWSKNLSTSVTQTYHCKRVWRENLLSQTTILWFHLLGRLTLCTYLKRNVRNLKHGLCLRFGSPSASLHLEQVIESVIIDPKVIFFSPIKW